MGNAITDRVGVRCIAWLGRSFVHSNLPVELSLINYSHTAALARISIQVDGAGRGRTDSVIEIDVELLTRGVSNLDSRVPPSLKAVIVAR